MTTHKVVFGAFKTPAGAQSAVHTLESHGFLHRDISVLMTESARQHFATVQKNTKGSEGAAVGGVAGGIIGAMMFFFFTAIIFIYGAELNFVLMDISEDSETPEEAVPA